MVTRRSMMERELSHQMRRARHDTQRLKSEMHESLCNRSIRDPSIRGEQSLLFLTIGFI